MKTSNIIVLSTIIFILFANIWIIVDAKNKFKTVLNQEETQLENIDLEDFSHIVISDEARVMLDFDDFNSFQQNTNKESKLTVRNDTLFISDETKISLTCKNIKSIQLSDKSSLNLKELNTNYLMVSAFDESRFIANNTSLEKLDLYAKKEARVTISQSNIDTTNILAKDHSRVGVKGELGVVRGEVKDDSNLAVTGAQNTQFSKTGNASVKMY